MSHPTRARFNRRRPIWDRFQENFEVGTGGCWLWTARIEPNGYAKFGFERTHVYAHRMAYALYRGPIPHGMDLDHLCRVRHCVNPYHLEAVTRQENLRRGTGVTGLNARKTHCKHGHAFIPSNTWVNHRGHRFCRECNKLKARARRFLELYPEQEDSE